MKDSLDKIFNLLLFVLVGVCYLASGTIAVSLVVTYVQTSTVPKDGIKLFLTMTLFAIGLTAALMTINMWADKK
jgi:hypothetical protein